MHRNSRGACSWAVTASLCNMKGQQGSIEIGGNPHMKNRPKQTEKWGAKENSYKTMINYHYRLQLHYQNVE